MGNLFYRCKTAKLALGGRRIIKRRRRHNHTLIAALLVVLFLICVYLGSLALNALTPDRELPPISLWVAA